jgi:tetratricopeptide (TPR) repeat protein
MALRKRMGARPKHIRTLFKGLSVDKSVDRIKCAMLIFELERGLGRLCKEKSDRLESSSTTAEIKKRLDRDDADHLTVVENSYLAEVLSMSRHVCKGTSLESWIENLASLIAALSIYEIRNAVSHPNRPFPDFYWFRCAAIASDPCIDALGLSEVALAFSNAQEGKIQEPPEDWLHKMRWSVPAVLPEQFEHSITGLVGRARDAAKLEREIENSRLPLISIVARGGVGKTSLLLQVVSDFCLSPKSTNYFDAAIWETLKQERLTEHGVEPLEAPASLSELKASLAKSIGDMFGLPQLEWQGAVEATKNKRLLLCLDNLEVLLRDHALEFQELHESLPSTWKVVVTSRIPVDGAKNIPLDVLDKNGGIAMVRAYLSSKGYDAAQDTALMEKIAVGCKYNPLAIRLTVDLLLAGKEVDFALQKTEQEVLAFSFTSLLESLINLDNEVLEALFVLDAPTRVDLCNALKASVDAVAESLAKLLSMSLILRRDQDGAEKYSLAPSIRDLLRAYPRKAAIRGKIATWVANSRASEEFALRVQAERNISPVALNYIPSGVIAAYITLCHQADAASKHGDRTGLLQALATCRSKIALDSESPFLHRVLGIVLLGLDDSVEAIASFQRAHALDPSDPAPLFGLLTAYNDSRRWRDIESVGDELLEAGWGEPSKAGGYFANRVWSATLRSANLVENVSKVFDKTSDWESRLEDLPSLAIGRASAYRRTIEIEARQNRLEPERLLALLAKACVVLTKVARSGNLPRWICAEFGRLISDIKRLESRDSPSSNVGDRDSILSYLQICCQYSVQLALGGVAAGLLDYARGVIGGVAPSEPVSTQRLEELLANGFILTRVKNSPMDSRRYFFVQDDQRNDYYVNLDQFEEGKAKNRIKLYPGANVAIKVATLKDGNAPKAAEAWLVP